MSESFLKGSPTLYSVTMAAVFISMYIIGRCRKGSSETAWQVLPEEEIENLQIKIDQFQKTQLEGTIAKPRKKHKKHVLRNSHSSSVAMSAGATSECESQLERDNSQDRNTSLYSSHQPLIVEEEKHHECDSDAQALFTQYATERNSTLEQELFEAAERLHNITFVSQAHSNQWESDLVAEPLTDSNFTCNRDCSSDEGRFSQAYGGFSDDGSDLSQEIDLGHPFESAEAATDAIIKYKRALMQKVAHLRMPNNSWSPNIAEQREVQLQRLGSMLNLRHPVERIPFVLQYYRDAFESVREEPGNAEFVERLANYYFALCMVRANRMHSNENTGVGNIEVDSDEENITQEITCADLINVAPKEIPTQNSWSTPLLELLREAFDFCLRSPNTLSYVEKRLAEAARMYFRALVFRLRHLEGLIPYCRGWCDGIRKEMSRVEAALGKIDRSTGSGYAAGAA